jgi:hypothetical protein
VRSVVPGRARQRDRRQRPALRTDRRTQLGDESVLGVEESSRSWIVGVASGS